MKKRIVMTVFLSLFMMNGLSFGQTPQDEMINTISVICPQLFALNSSGMLNAVEQDLLATCTDVILEPVSADQQNAAGQLTSDETHTMKTVSVEITSAQQLTVLSRLAALRGTGSTGTLAFHQNTPFDPHRLFAGPVSLTEQKPSAESFNSRLNFFANGSYSTGDRDTTVNEPGFDFDGSGFTIGADYQLSNDLVVGAAVGYSKTDTEIDLNRGDVDLDGYGLSLFGSYSIGDLFFDLIGSYGKKDYETVRNVRYAITSQANPGTMTTVDQTFGADTDANDWAVSLGAGYNYFRSGFTISPQLRLNYYNSQIDGYTETLVNANTNSGYGAGLIVDEQNITSFTSALGGQIAYAVKTGFGVVSPQIRAEWIHEFKNDVLNLNARYINGSQTTGNIINIPGDEPDRDYLNIGAGVSTVFPRGIMVFLDYATILGLENISSHVVTAGVRYEF